MALTTNDVLDLTKENIQPLRCGRKAAQLKTALQAQVDPETQQELNKQREKYEFMIRMYEGDDPLNPYYDYILWLEQSFPKMGRESNIMSVIEDAIIKFKDFDKYKQDHRFVKIMIKYISAQSNPLELYQEVYGRGLGTMCSALYKAWAEELDKRNDFKRANQVFQLGISCRATPLQELEDAQIQFQLSIARRMLEGNMNEVVEDSGRNALSKLPSTKVNVNRASKDLAGVFQSNVNKLDSQRGSNHAVPKFKVFEEEVENDGIRDFKSKNDKLPKGSISDRENVVKAIKWCGQKQKQGFKKPSTPATPSFPIHEDPDAECKVRMSVLRPRALKVRRDEFNCPVAVFEPPDPTKIPMYPKHQVYVGGRDVQLEEIRAAYYWKKVKIEEEQRANEQNFNMDISEEPVDLTKSSNSSTDQRLDIAQKHDQKCVQEFTKFTMSTESSVPKPAVNSANSFILEPSVLPTFVKPVSQKPPLESRPSAGVSRRSEAFMMPTNLYNRKFEYMDVISQTELRGEKNQLSSSNKTAAVQNREVPSSKFNVVGKDEIDAVAQSEKFDSFGKLTKLDDDPDFRTSDQNNISVFHHSPSTSITVNTRAAMNVIQKMWESPLATHASRNQAAEDDFCEAVFKMPTSVKAKNVGQPSFAEPAEGNSRAPFKPFKVFADDSASHEVAKPSNRDPLFPVYADQDDDGLSLRFSSPKARKLPFPMFREERQQRGIADDLLLELPPVKPKITAPSTRLDEDLALPMGSLRMNEADQRTPLPLIVPVNLQDTPLEPEDKENRPPKDYSTPSERRPLTGILTPATGVPVKELNSDDSEDEENWQHGRDNEFDESCNTKAFAIRLPSSTPSSRPEYSRAPRRSSLYNGSYISEDGVGPSATNQAYSVATAISQAATSKNTGNLSLILENSKEQGSSSSSGHSANVVSRNFY